MTDFWTVPTFEQVKAKKYKVRKNYNFNKMPRSMCELKPLVRKEQAILLTQLMGFSQTKHQASKRGYRHEHGDTKSHNLLGKKTLKIERNDG